MATTLHVSSTNTWSLLPEARALPSFSAPPLFAHEPSALDAAMGALSPNDAVRYRAIFAAQRSGDLARADEIISTLRDRRLLGHVLADRYQRGQGTAADFKTWLVNYADLPEAGTIYVLARKQGSEKTTELPKPRAPEPWSSGYETGDAGSFDARVKAEKALLTAAGQKYARGINQFLRRKNPAAALDLLKTAIAEGVADGAFVAEADAAISAGYFYMGEREQAWPLAGKAAEAGQPLGLWMRGLMAWEKEDYSLAAASFTKLAADSELDAANRSAAVFWGYRALIRCGHAKDARRYLEQSARDMNSFYGILASQVLGRGPGVSLQEEAVASAWGGKERAILIGHAAGWRALALVQIGEAALAESELRRLNPRGDAGLQFAMLALARYVPMPGLGLQLAGLSGGAEGVADAVLHYPLPPWRPQNGFEVDRALLYALARHESRFDPDAVSARGARGLLQIMPATARGMEGRGLKPAAAKLFDPEYNLELGQRYVRHLLQQRQIGDNLILLLTAYNAGPAKAVRWASTQKDRLGQKAFDPLLFVESLPQSETRGYVMRVLAHYWAYRARLDEPTVTLRQLAEGKWPRLPAPSDKITRKVEAGESAGPVKVASNR